LFRRTLPQCEQVNFGAFVVVVVDVADVGGGIIIIDDDVDVGDNSTGRRMTDGKGLGRIPKIRFDDEIVHTCRTRSRAVVERLLLRRGAQRNAAQLAEQQRIALESENIETKSTPNG
jgi:hypothetical protein